ncbi:uncharacterized protein LOC110729623 [Chenopodium quinoa]|uniref:uncharacterized protein LOC110729623 n=1 Tax=Chenopodium quinoa TaxID=63459 RepID=UPI000B77A869|nr:uncharacterized protein LOC110729623 [Chenopodium quinoa]
MMARVNNSVDTVNAAAAAIVSAESRVQPGSLQKRRWGSCWNLYWCFGSLKTSKRISHATLVPEPTVTESTEAITDNPNPSTSIVLPFIAPPSSPTSFLQSDPPTATHSPGGLLTVTPLSANAFSCSGNAHMFTIGPYAHETQLVSPPVFSAFTSEPSTAAVTPPPEPVQFTTPSSPEVPFAQLLTSSLKRSKRNSGTNHKLALSCYEVHHLISPGSANSASGTSSPYFDRRPVLEFRMVDASKLFDSKSFSTRKWGSRLGSGSLTPDGAGFAPYDGLLLENQISEVASLANSETGSPIAEALIDHRVSFELCREDVSTYFEKKVTEGQHKTRDQYTRINEASHKVENCCLCSHEVLSETHESTSDVTKDCQHKKSSLSLGSVKEFNFDSRNRESTGNSNLSSEWWADENVGKEIGAQSNWSFFPLLQPGVS